MDLLAIVLKVFSGGTVSVVLRLILALVLSGMVVWILRWVERQRLKQAKDATDADRNNQQSKIDDDNRQIFDDAKKSEDEIEELIRKRGANKNGEGAKKPVDPDGDGGFGGGGVGGFDS